jgi:hypothetical protein
MREEANVSDCNFESAGYVSFRAFSTGGCGFVDDDIAGELRAHLRELLRSAPLGNSDGLPHHDAVIEAAEQYRGALSYDPQVRLWFGKLFLLGAVTSARCEEYDPGDAFCGSINERCRAIAMSTGKDWGPAELRAFSRGAIYYATQLGYPSRSVDLAINLPRRDGPELSF